MKPLRPIRTPASRNLDSREIRQRGGNIVTVPDAQPWANVYDMLAHDWKVGEHMALVGKTKSGKTTFAREALMLRDWVVVLGTKIRDPDLYQAFQRQGYVVKHRWSPFDTKDNRVIFAPPLTAPTKEGKAAQAEAFRKALVELFRLERGNWTVYSDELYYLTHDLGLKTEIDTLYMQGRALELTMVAATQRPVGVPRNMFAMAEWLGIWRTPDMDDRLTAAQKTGALKPTVIETSAILPQHEMLLVNTVNDSIARTKVYT